MITAPLSGDLPGNKAVTKVPLSGLPYGTAPFYYRVVGGQFSRNGRRLVHLTSIGILMIAWDLKTLGLLLKNAIQWHVDLYASYHSRRIFQIVDDMIV